MDCRRVRRSLMEYADGGLSEARRQVVSRHLKTCEDCSGLAEKLATSASALSALSPIEMPQEASRRVLGTLESPERAAPSAKFFRSPRTLTTAGIAATALIALAVVVGVFTLGGPGKTPQQSKNAQEQLAVGTAAESQTSGAQNTVQTSAVAPVDTLVLPVAKVTGNNYDQDSIKKMADVLEVKDKFAERYSMVDAINLSVTYRRKLADDFATLGGDGAILEAMISFVQSTESVLLPCYAEMASYNGQPVYIVGLSGPTRSAPNKLARTEFWIMNPGRFSSSPDNSILNMYQTTKQ